MMVVVPPMDTLHTVQCGSERSRGLIGRGWPRKRGQERRDNRSGRIGNTVSLERRDWVNNFWNM